MGIFCVFLSLLSVSQSLRNKTKLKTKHSKTKRIAVGTLQVVSCQKLCRKESSEDTLLINF